MKDNAFAVTHTEAEWRALLSPSNTRSCASTRTERAGSCALNTEKRAGVFSCAGCGQPLFESADQVRQRHGLAELQRPRARLGRDHGRSQLGHDAHRGALRALRLASRPRLPRRAAADASALLHQRRGDEFHAGLTPSCHRVDKAGGHERADLARRLSRLAASRGPSRRSGAGASACCSSISARPRRPTIGRCAAISRNSCPTGA